MCEVRKSLPVFCRQLCTSQNSTANLGQTTSNIIERHFSLSKKAFHLERSLLVPPRLVKKSLFLLSRSSRVQALLLIAEILQKIFFYYSVNGISLQLSKKGKQTKERINELLSQQKLFNVTTAFKTLRD